MTGKQNTHVPASLLSLKAKVFLLSTWPISVFLPLATMKIPTADFLSQKLAGYPESALQKGNAFAAAPSVATLDSFLREILAFHLPSTARRAPDWEATASLKMDVGLDSMGIAECVFLLEDLFDVSISNEQLLQLEKYQDLLAFLSALVAEASSV